MNLTIYDHYDQRARGHLSEKKNQEWKENLGEERKTVFRLSVDVWQESRKVNRLNELKRKKNK